MFESSKTVITGNPLRRELLAREAKRKPKSHFQVLVLGGSQGSHALNRAVVETLDRLRSPAQIKFVHQAGSKDASWVAQAYVSRGLNAEVEPFFEDMTGPYNSADLVVCRAGATTVAELMALGKPAIFVPFPFAVNNHQELNARYVADVGGAEIVLEKDLSGGLLADKFEYYLKHPEVLDDMAKRTLALARPNAADVIVDECMKLAASG
jgi:UDP-N-acetylglucosamine--N-acetylmuramyl-(pentapeptide) pyrophosphoryl-undecaprenol N-acetylglucosamine transferase